MNCIALGFHSQSSYIFFSTNNFFSCTSLNDYVIVYVLNSTFPAKTTKTESNHISSRFPVSCCFIRILWFSVWSFLRKEAQQRTVLFLHIDLRSATKCHHNYRFVGHWNHKSKNRFYTFCFAKISVRFVLISWEFCVSFATNCVLRIHFIWHILVDFKAINDNSNRFHFLFYDIINWRFQSVSFSLSLCVCSRFDVFLYCEFKFWLPARNKNSNRIMVLFIERRNHRLMNCRHCVCFCCCPKLLTSLHTISVRTSFFRIHIICSSGNKRSVMLMARIRNLPNNPNSSLDNTFFSLLSISLLSNYVINSISYPHGPEQHRFDSIQLCSANNEFVDYL